MRPTRPDDIASALAASRRGVPAWLVGIGLLLVVLASSARAQDDAAGADGAPDPQLPESADDHTDDDGDDDKKRFEVEVVVEGNDQVGDGTVKDMAKRSLKAVEHSGSRADMTDAAYDVEAGYLRRGFPKVQVRFHSETLPPKKPGEKRRITLTFEVEEGPRVEVAEIRFPGQSGIFDVEHLRKFFEPLRTGAFGLGPRWYSAGKVGSATGQIAALYRLRGYLDVQVTADDPLQNERAWLAEDKIRLLVTIHEGIQYTLRELALPTGVIDEDDRESLRHQLDGLIRARTEEFAAGTIVPFSPQLLSALRAMVVAWFRGRGHYRPEVVVHRDINRETGYVKVRFSITPGPTHRVGEIRFTQPDPQLREGFLRGRIPLRANEEQEWTLALERESYQQIMKTNLVTQLRFAGTERVEQTPDGPVHYVDYDVIVEELDSVELRLLAGYGSWELLRGSIKLTENNIFGIARGVSAEVFGSFKTVGGTLTFDDPWTLGGDWPYSISGTISHRVEPNFTNESIEGEFSLRHRINRSLAVRFGYTFTRTNIFDIGAGVDLADVDPSVRLGALSARFTIDTRDGVVEPRDGVSIVLGTEWHSRYLGGDVDFVRVTLRFSAFAHLVENALVFGIRYQTGANFPYGTSEVPLQERFRNGGQNTVRSFAEGELLRLDELGPDTSGGRVFNVASVEIRHIIVWQLWGAVFFDVGNLVNNYDTWFTPNTLRFGLGYGLRLLTPIGPARFDFAWNFDRRGDISEDEFVFHFSIGYAF